MRIEPLLKPVDSNENIERLNEYIKPGGYRWAIYDRKTSILYFGRKECHIHMTVAEESGVLCKHPEYYHPITGNILGGFICCSLDGFYYFDPFSGTFPGTIEGVAEAEKAFEIICEKLELPNKKFDDIPRKYRAEGGDEVNNS